VNWWVSIARVMGFGPPGGASGSCDRRPTARTGPVIIARSRPRVSLVRPLPGQSDRGQFRVRVPLEVLQDVIAAPVLVLDSVQRRQRVAEVVRHEVICFFSR